MTKEEKYYIAALIDWKMHFLITKRNKAYLVMYSRRKERLEHIAKIVQCGTIESVDPGYEYRLNATECEEIFSKVKPYLKIKSKNVELLLEFEKYKDMLTKAQQIDIKKTLQELQK
jgi:hypothetical protein